MQEARADFVAAYRDAVAAGDPGRGRRATRGSTCVGCDCSGATCPVGRRLPLDEVVEHNHTGLARATELGDAVSAAMVPHPDRGPRVQPAPAAHRRWPPRPDAVRPIAAAGRPEALARSLDGLKAVHAYCGDAAALAVVLDELLPLLDELQIPWLRQWALQESALVPAAAGDWAAARRRDRRGARGQPGDRVRRLLGVLPRPAGLARAAGRRPRRRPRRRPSRGGRAVADGPSRGGTRRAVGGFATRCWSSAVPTTSVTLCRAGLDALGPEAGAA